MLQLLRSKASGIISWLIIGLIIIAFSSWGLSGIISSDREAYVAKVNGQKITEREVEQQYNQMINQSRHNPNFDITQIDPIETKQQIAKSLVKSRAFISELEKHRFRVSDEHVILAIKSESMFHEDGRFSPERYTQILKNAGLTSYDYEQLVREKLVSEQARTGLLLSSFVLPQEISKIDQLRFQTRDVGYVQISAQNYTKTAKVTDEEVSDYYTEYKSTFMSPEQVKLAYLELSLENLENQQNASEQELKIYYQDNISSFTEPELINIRHIMIAAPEGSDARLSGEARDKIEDIYNQLRLGGDFAKLAKEKSEDSSSSPHGGDLGWVSYNDPYPQEVFNIEKAGDYTDIVETEYGLHIFQLIERKESKQKPFDDVISAIEKRYKREKAEHMFSQMAEELANLTYENPETLLIASERLGIPIKFTDFFGKEGGDGIAKATIVVNSAFNDDILNANRNSDILRVNDDTYVVIRVYEYKPSRIQEYDEVKDVIKNHLKNLAAQKRVEEVGKQILEKLQNNEPPHKVCEKYNLVWKVKKQVTRDSEELSPEILKNLFSIVRPESGKNTWYGFKSPLGDYTVIGLSAVHEGKSQDIDDESLQDLYKQQISMLVGNQEFFFYKDDLVNDATIKYTNQK